MTAIPAPKSPGSKENVAKFFIRGLIIQDTSFIYNLDLKFAFVL